MKADYTIKGTWTTQNDEHVYTAKAVTKTGLILAKVNVHIGIDTAFDMQQFYGPEALKEAEKSAANIVQMVVHDRKGSE